MNRQQTRRAARPFAHGVQQPESVLDNLFFVKHFAAQSGEGGAKPLRLLHHKLRRTAVGRDIRQTSRRDHAARDGLLLAENPFQFCLLLRQAEGRDMRDTDVIAGFL